MHTMQIRNLYLFQMICITLLVLTMAPTVLGLTTQMPGNGRIVFASDRDGDYEIYLMNEDGSHIIQLTKNNARDLYPVWSPDGTTIAFVSDRSSAIGTLYDLYLMNADGTNVRAVISNQGRITSPAWSPIDQRLSFIIEDHQGRQDIAVASTTGADFVNLTVSLDYFYNRQPAWFSDGSGIVFSSSDTEPLEAPFNTSSRLMVYRFSDSSFSLLLAGLNGFVHPDLSLFDTIILYSVGNFGNFQIARLEGSSLVFITSDDRQHIDPRWSPDREYITFVGLGEPEGDIFVIDSDGRIATNLTNSPNDDDIDPDWEPVWNPEATATYISTSTETFTPTQMDTPT